MPARPEHAMGMLPCGSAKIYLYLLFAAPVEHFFPAGRGGGYCAAAASSSGTITPVMVTPTRQKF